MESHNEHDVDPLDEVPTVKIRTGAPEGQVWLCEKSGRISKDRYGITNRKDNGWDEECAVNAVLVYENTIERDPTGRVLTAELVTAG